MFNRLLSIVNDAKEKVEDVRDKKLEEIENAKLKETWYVSKIDKFNYVRIIHLQSSNTFFQTVHYRTLENINEIAGNNVRVRNPNGFHIDVTEYAHCKETLNEKVFKERFSPVDITIQHQDGSYLVSELEARYQDVVKNWKDRLTEYERIQVTNFSEAESQRRLNQFLHPTSGIETVDIIPVVEIENVDHNNYANGMYNYFSGSSRTININPYGGTAEIPTSLLPTEYKKVVADQVQQEPEIIQEPQKRLESID